MSLTREEFDGFMQHWDEPTRTRLLNRMKQGYRREVWEHFSEEERILLGTVLARLIPQEDGIDLVAFLDWAVEQPLGRGDRREGTPPEPDLFHAGLQMLKERSGATPFQKRTPQEQDDLLKALQGDPFGGMFFTRLLTKALAGYCAHPLAWMRMGFPGPSYPEGYVWVTQGEIRQRRRHFPGWKTL